LRGLEAIGCSERSHPGPRLASVGVKTETYCRVGKKPVPLPANVKNRAGQHRAGRGPKAETDAMTADRHQLEKAEATVNRRAREEETRRLHGFPRPGFERRRGRDQGWTKDLDIVGIGYRAELKGKGSLS